MTHAVREIGIRWFEEVWNRGRREAIPEMLAPDAALHDADSHTTGTEDFSKYFDRIQATLSEMQLTVEDTIVEGDRVCVRWSSTGRHTGDGLGLPATGRRVRVTGITVLRVADGRIVEGWQNWDMLGLLEQIRSGERMGEAQKPPTYVAP